MLIRSIPIVSIVSLLVASAPRSVRADMIAPPSMPERVAKADGVVLGKVTSVEKKEVEATLYPASKRKYPLQIGIVKVDRVFKGPIKETHVRVAFRPPVLGLERRPQATLQVGQEVCLFLTRHPEEPFYYVPMYFDVLRKTKNPTFAKDITTIEQSAKLLAKPLEGLRSKDAEERFLTAVMLLTQYRTPKGKPFQTEPIPQEESKLILAALAETDWKKPRKQYPFLMPINVFARVGATPADGWTPPKNFKEYPDAAKKWIREHSDTFRIKKYVENRGS